MNPNIGTSNAPRALELINITLTPSTVVAGAFTLVSADSPPDDNGQTKKIQLPNDWRHEWWVSGGQIEDLTAADDAGYKAKWHTENLPPGTYEIRLRTYADAGGVFNWESSSAYLVVNPHAGYTPLEVSLERSDIPRTADIALW